MTEISLLHTQCLQIQVVNVFRKNCFMYSFNYFVVLGLEIQKHLPTVLSVTSNIKITDDFIL